MEQKLYPCAICGTKWPRNPKWAHYPLKEMLCCTPERPRVTLNVQLRGSSTSEI